MAVYQHHLLIFLYLTLLIPTISHNISAPITFPGLMASSSAPFNLTALLELEKAGCKIFASLITTSGVLKIYELALDNGGFTFTPEISNLSRTHLVTILQYHVPKALLKTARGPIATMASSSSGKYNLSVICHGDEVSLSTRVSTAHVASTVLDDTPMSVLTVESLLLPSEPSIGVPVLPTAPDQVALTATPVPSTAPAPGAEAPLPEMSLPRGPTCPPTPPRPCPPPRPRPPPTGPTFSSSSTSPSSFTTSTSCSFTSTTTNSRSTTCTFP